MRGCLGIILMLCFIVSSAHANNGKEQFQQSYAAFQEALQTDANAVELTQLAEDAYQSGERYFGTDHINTANLKLSYLNVVDAHTLRSRTSQLLAEEVVKIYRSFYDANDPERTVALLVALNTLSSQSDLDTANDYYDEIIAIAETNTAEQPSAMFELRIEAAAHMLRIGSRSSHDLVDLAETASAQFGSQHHLTLLANFHAGRYFEAAQQHDQALEAFTLLAAHDAESLPAALQDAKYMSHARLVALLEQQGRSDEATQHCLAISQMGYGVQDERDPTPLYRVPPEYPRPFAHNGVEGVTTVRYDIDEMGWVRNIEILDSKHKLFSESAIAAMQQWRFAPRLHEGETVVTSDRTTRFIFELD
ncbi:energy transducer TonB [Pseudidiomarina homiensis]|uniref:TonB C-terminal domain-containing protein n=1 Tax=Pseudidiomarina homiensis TaxID=364198 RepID=A0A432Y5W9_9GAMM|nr:energy transducer TonB [Pseudidiomarina homiensis]RUO56360.1 hypothetical protein CWI70_06325 [Pseudidiomarina homiensis]